jgi:thiol:disulfide interchange protein
MRVLMLCVTPLWLLEYLLVSSVGKRLLEAWLVAANLWTIRLPWRTARVA